MSAATQTTNYAGESTAELSQQAGKLREERDRLAQQTSTARDELADLRARLVTGDATLRDVTLVQAKVAALEGALADADAELARLRTAIVEAERREAERAEAARLDALHAERERLQREFDVAALELDAACERVAQRMHAITQRYAETSAELREASARAGNVRVADIYARDKGCRWPQLKYREQAYNVLMVYSREEARREDGERRAARASGHG